MKVILSVDPIKFPLTGIGRYTYELSRGLQQKELENLLLMRWGRLLTEPPTSYTGDQVKANWLLSLREQVLEVAKKSRLAGALYGAAEPWLKGRVLKNYESYVYHGPNFFLPPHNGPSVVTIHDLSVYLWSHTHPPARVYYMHKQIARALKTADYIITDTEYTRQEVSAYFNWPLERIRAVHLAGSPEFYPRTVQELEPALANLGLASGGYTLYAGTVEPRKNLKVLLHAYEKLPNALRRRWPLVITGYRGWLSDDLHGRMETAQREGWLRYLGFVEAETLPLIMAGSRLLVFPSLYEGFGLPVLEAMASGVPVICSSASCLPEVTGNAAALHDPDDADGLCELLLQGLGDDVWCARQREAGLKRASQFSWERCVNETLSVYRAARDIYL